MNWYSKIGDFEKHTAVFFAVLAVVGLGMALGVSREVLQPLAEGLGVSLPVILGSHGLASAIRSRVEVDVNAAGAAGDGR